MEFEHRGRTYKIFPCRTIEIGTIWHECQMVAGYSYDPHEGYHVRLADAPGETRGPHLIECFRSLLD